MAQYPGPLASVAARLLRRRFCSWSLLGILALLLSGCLPGLALTGTPSPTPTRTAAPRSVTTRTPTATPAGPTPTRNPFAIPGRTVTAQPAGTPVLSKVDIRAMDRYLQDAGPVLDWQKETLAKTYEQYRSQWTPGDPVQGARFALGVQSLTAQAGQRMSAFGARTPPDTASVLHALIKRSGNAIVETLKQFNCRLLSEERRDDCRAAEEAGYRQFRQVWDLADRARQVLAQRAGIASPTPRASLTPLSSLIPMLEQLRLASATVLLVLDGYDEGGLSPDELCIATGYKATFDGAPAALSGIPPYPGVDEAIVNMRTWVREYSGALETLNGYCTAIGPRRNEADLLKVRAAVDRGEEARSMAEDVLTQFPEVPPPLSG